MASGDGIDSIELDSNTIKQAASPIAAVPASDLKGNIIATKLNSGDDDDKLSTEGKMSNDMSGDPTQVRRTGDGSRYKTQNEKERKIGHRRVGEGGEITYKKIQTTQIMGSIQLGIQHTVGSLASKPKRDLLMMDFFEIETISFPENGSNLTPAHHYNEFKFKIYAPIAFRYFRDLFGIQPDDFMMSMCSSPLRELSNPGASGSIFYLTNDDEFIIKTVQHKEGEFLQKLLPGYYMNLNQNPRTLLPKFFGLYCYQCNSKNVRLIVMNNLLPSYVKLHEKYDLKGSTYKRKASKGERTKRTPTYKDLDFMELHPNGISLEADTYNALIKTIQRDCRVLESFKIMDYSLLVGVHNLDKAAKEKQEERNNQQNQMLSRSPKDDESDMEDQPEADQFMAEERERGATALNRSRSINRQRLVAHSTAMESIQAESEPIDEEEDVPPGGIPARNEKGERLLLFIGIIDILQSYRIKKKLEHTFKSIIHDGDTVSVCRPSFYAQRFQDFMAKYVFKKIPSPLKHSPSKRKSLSRAAQRSTEAEADAHPVAGSSQNYHASSSASKLAIPTTAAQSTTASTTSKPIVTTAPSQSHHLPPLKQKSNIVKQKVPPPVPPRGSPKVSKRGGSGVHNKNNSNIQTSSSGGGTKGGSGLSPGTAPSCSSTPPPAFDDISEHGSSSRNFDDRGSGERRVHVNTTSRSGTYREDTVSISEIRLDSHYMIDSSSAGSHYDSRGALAWTPPASVEGSTPTWTEGTPSFTESSSSGEMSNSSPLNTSASDRHKPTVEEALNSLTSEMVIQCCKTMEVILELDEETHESKISIIPEHISTATLMVSCHPSPDLNNMSKCESVNLI